MSKPISKGTIALIFFGAVIVVLVLGTLSSYNGLISKEETVNTAWSNLQSQYQRRADLIPNLVNTVKGYTSHENETLTKVVEARAKATSLMVNAEDLTPERAKQIQEAQSELSNLVGRLLMVQESYPELKASEQFSELQAQLEGTENRIAESRRAYNESAKEFNVSVRKFPTNIVAGIFGFERKTQFEAQAGAEQAPTVNF